MTPDPRAPAKAVSRRRPGIRSHGRAGVLRRAALVARARARLRHLPRLPSLLQPVQRVSAPVRCDRRNADRGARRGRHKVYWEVVDHCYLCDMCYMTKCPYVPPHPWNIDFPHLMLRAKAVRFRQATARRCATGAGATDPVGTLAGIPVVAQVVNAVNRTTRRAPHAREDARRASRRRRCPNITARTGRKRVARGRNPARLEP